MSSEKRNIPKRRFKEFKDAGAWEQRKLGDCFRERNERSAEGELISVTINDGIKKFSELNRHDNSSKNKSNYKKVCIGDLAYNSMRMWQGASGYSVYTGIMSPAYTILIPEKFVDAKFFSYAFKRPIILKKFQANSQGITSDTWNLKYPALSQISTQFPHLNEQTKIRNLLDKLDNLITLHQRKLEKLKSLKSAYLSEMFPTEGERKPKRRFKGFTDDWEQRKFGEVVQRAHIFSCELSLPRVEYEDINAGQGTLNKDLSSKRSTKKGLYLRVTPKSWTT